MRVSYRKKCLLCRKGYFTLFVGFALIICTVLATTVFRNNSYRTESRNFFNSNSTQAAEFRHIGVKQFFETPDQDEPVDDAEKDMYSDNTYMQNFNETAVRRLPQSLIIGVKKCGTRALLEFLRIHPDIRAPGPEPHFFDRYYDRGLEWYRNQMPPSIGDQITIEKTPRYFISEDVPEKVFNMSKDIKLILVVRDPVIRAISDFTQGASKSLSDDSKTFEEKAFGSNGSDVVDTSWSAIQTGYYAYHLRRWLKFFPFKQIHVVWGENLITNPAKEMEGVQDFLGINRVISEKHFYFNETKGFPCLKKHEGNPVAKCFNSGKGRPHPYVPPNVIKKLYAFYRPHIEDFYKLTGRNFGWL